jgi:hypothetical protein
MAPMVYVTLNGSQVVLWKTRALPTKPNELELIPLMLISIGMSTMSFRWVMVATLLLPDNTEYYGSPCKESDFFSGA